MVRMDRGIAETTVTQEVLEDAIAKLLEAFEDIASRRLEYKQEYLEGMHEQFGECLVLPYESVDEDGDPDYNDDLEDTLDDIINAIRQAQDLITDTLPNAVAIAKAKHNHGLFLTLEAT